MLSMGIISPTNNTNSRPYQGSKKALADAMSYAAQQMIESPIDGTKMSMWQAVVKRLYNTAIYAESDKDATSAAKVIAERLFGRAPVQKQENKHEIPAIVFTVKDSEINDIKEKAARAEPDCQDDDGITPIELRLDDGSEMTV